MNSINEDPGFFLEEIEKEVKKLEDNKEMLMSYFFIHDDLKNDGSWGIVLDKDTDFGAAYVLWDSLIEDNQKMINRLLSFGEVVVFYDFFIEILEEKNSKEISKNDIDEYIEKVDITLSEKLNAEELAEYFLEIKNNSDFEIFKTRCSDNPRYKDVYAEIIEDSDEEAFTNLVKKYYKYHSQQGASQ